MNLNCTKCGKPPGDRVYCDSWECPELDWDIIANAPRQAPEPAVPTFKEFLAGAPMNYLTLSGLPAVATYHRSGNEPSYLKIVVPGRRPHCPILSEVSLGTYYNAMREGAQKSSS